MTLDRLVPHLLLNYHFVPNAGLLNGKMGGVLFFGQYAAYTNKFYLRDYAEELLKDVFEIIHENTPINFANGLCGIGWGIEYLIQNAYIDGDSDEVLEQVDRKVIERDTIYMEDLSLETGLRGVLLYVIARLKHKRPNNSFSPFPEEYIQRIFRRIAQITHQELEEDTKLQDVIGWFNDCFSEQNNMNTDYLKITDEFYGQLPDDLRIINHYPLGIHQGLTGIAFKSIQK